MNEDLDILTQPFLQKTISECTVPEIKGITQAYPYFAPAQLALLKKLKKEALPEYDIQLQKAVLYYYNPLQFEAFIHSEKFTTSFDFDTDIIENVTPHDEERVKAAEEGVLGIEEQSIINFPEKEKNSEAILPPPVERNEISHINEPEYLQASSQEDEVPKTDAPPAFEPYHTVDYFASQGIKLSQEEVPTDRIGKQLKSFTAWLKTMKKLPASELTKDLDPGSENKVMDMAAHSIESASVVTEAMAEVWLKQGNTEKAIEVYNKLSLQNPSKKAYFAAKIDHLKKAS